MLFIECQKFMYLTQWVGRLLIKMCFKLIYST